MFKKEYSDFVDLSIGRIYIKPITNGMRNKILSRSTIAGTVINNNLFFQLWEYNIVCLSNRKINNLSVKDGDKLRLKIREILKRYGIIEESKKEPEINNDENVFTKADKVWLDQSLNNAKAKYGVNNGK